jgi:ATP-dependent exoDNAse (exonuclease V) beta subunit
MSFPFNISQRLGLDLDKHIAIDAGAGTGKTAVMAERYIQHLLAEHQRAKRLLPNGPRVPLQGQGALRAPARERSNLVEWKGLLPSEVVAITFTRKAASELRNRIRKRLNNTDINLYSITDGDVEMLLSRLEDAPISTIDAFLSRLVTPYLDILTTQPAGDQIAETRSPMLISETINSAWRIRTKYDAMEAGVLGDRQGFIDARNNLAILLGGQQNAETVLSGLLNTSLFVEETKRSIKQKSEEKGIDWRETELVDSEIILDLIGRPAESFIDNLCTELRGVLNNWLDTYLEQHGEFILPFEQEIDSDRTRFNQLVELARNIHPDDNIGKLQWFWLVAVSCTSKSSLDGGNHNHFPRNKLPKSDGWPGGIQTNNKVNLSNKEISSITGQANPLAQQANDILNSNNGKLAKILGRSSYTFDPRIPLSFLPETSTLNYTEMTAILTPEPPTGRIRVSKELQLSVLRDLLIVHKGCQQILTLRKMQENVHDFDDIQLLAADLLLARCPEMVRYDYPVDVVDALDDLGNEPWTDYHIERARHLISDKYPQWRDDFERRVGVLKTIRQQFLAFIVDEYQDTNPAHFRLLSRLWGSRRINENSDPHGPWDPTVCIVGDMKQSIYRFRQAEVTVMRRTVENIKRMNEIEFHNTTFEFRDLNFGRDPRPIAGRDAFIQSPKSSSDLPVHKGEYNIVPLNKTDLNKTIEDDSIIEKRRLGHIDLTSNFRTAHDLLNTLNQIFADVFDERHHSLPGDYHAKPQPLQPAKGDTPHGKLEWLMPMSLENIPQTENEVFNQATPKSIHLEHEMIALRLQNLIQGRPCSIWNPSKQEYMTLEKPTETVKPSDITILIHSRTHIVDLINRLHARGIPVISDKQGQLLEQPIVVNLMSALDLLANPSSKFAAATVAKSPIIGLTDKELNQLLTTHEQSNNWWKTLAEFVPNSSVARLLEHIDKQIIGYNIHDIVSDILDNSDLLFAYPDDSSRQNAEQWCNLIYDIGNDCGHNPAEIFAQLEALRGLGNKGPQASATPSSGAVKIMTVHGAKGLESKVVVVSGIFQAGRYDANITTRENVLVTPEIISGRINPWASLERPDDGLWEFTKNINSAQNQAERRREFYVALTRVENHLIIVGNSTNKGQMCPETGMIQFTSKPSAKTMGHMWMEGLRSSAHKQNQLDSPWLKPDDIGVEELGEYQEHDVSLDPMMLYFNSKLGEGNIRSMAIFHNPDCFSDAKPVTPIERWKVIEDKIMANSLPKSAIKVSKNVTHTLKLGANSLDNSVKCRTHHWPNNLTNWNNHRLSKLLEKTSLAPEKIGNLPTAVEFGLMMHRLVEISLDNPSKYNAEPMKALPNSWFNKPEHELTSDESIEIVLGEFGFNKSDKGNTKRFNATFERMQSVAQLVDQGLTGRYAKGEKLHGRKAEGLRTELPFLYNHIVNVNSPRKVFRNNTMQEMSNVVNVEIMFEGRADLVMAYSDDAGDGYLQVVDMKTTGCLYGFNFDNPKHGTALQQFSCDLHNAHPSSQAEHEIIDKYKYQLTLYSKALEAIEAEKPIEERRIVLPPAILIAASGRTVEMSKEHYQQTMNELDEQLVWIGQLAANPQSIDEPNRMTMEHATVCWNTGIEPQD